MTISVSIISSSVRMATAIFASASASASTHKEQSAVDSAPQSFLSTQSAVNVIDIKPLDKPFVEPLSQDNNGDDEMVLALLQSQHEEFTKSLFYSSSKAETSSGAERVRYEQQVDSITANLAYLDEAIALHVSKMNQVVNEPAVVSAVSKDEPAFEYYTEKHVHWAESDDESDAESSGSESDSESETDSDSSSESESDADVVKTEDPVPVTVTVPVVRRTLSTAETCWSSTYRELISMGFEPNQFDSILTDCFGNLEATVSRLLLN
eukprot:GILJ01001467.1.p1 GENE.GILJ01001467.1~~GILJ01001467.1.p1  ORF type:complete len:266 (-),score=70.68 GILJ01001467.1:89-886(-)